MAHFQDSRFFGLSGRTLVVTIVVIVAVVGLFFLPETIKFALKSGRSSNGDKSASAGAKARKVTDEESDRGSLSPDALRALNSTVGATPTPGRAAPQGARKDSDEGGERGGFFSGWNFKVKAGEPNASSAPVASNMTIEKLGAKEFQNALKQGSNDIRGFAKKKFAHNPNGEEIALTFLSQVELASREATKGMNPKDLLAGLQDLHVSTIQALSQSGADRGVILEWLKIPLVNFIDDKAGVRAAQKVRAYFIPRMGLRTVSVRQRPSDGWGVDGRSPASLRAELAFKGSDIEKVIVYSNGRRVTEVVGSRGQSDSYRSVKVNGDAHGVWTFVAYDRFGGRPYWKSYSFYPKARRFRQSRTGEYLIAFKTGSAPNSLDRFFVVGSSALRQQSDPMVSVF